MTEVTGKPIPQRPLELAGEQLELSAVCLGGNVFGWTLDRAGSFDVLDAYVAHDGNFIDTADSYSAWAPGNSGGESEAIIGEWLASRGKRDAVVLATKVGHPGSPTTPAGGLSAAAIRRSVEASLRRLRTDHVDLLYAHRDDPATELAETLDAFDAMVREGKARRIAASNYPAHRLAAALALSDELGLTRFCAVQPRFNLVDRSELDELSEVVDRHRLGVFTHSTLAGGFLTGKYAPGEDPRTKRADDVRRYLTESNFEALAVLGKLAARHRATMASLALAWGLSQPRINSVIASATSVESLHELARAGSLQLSDEELRSLNASWTPVR